MSFLKTYRLQLPMLLFSAMLLLGRFMHTSSLLFLFLPWNLFLAILPLYFSYRLTIASSRTALAILLVLWLLFFPNAMYIVTDLFHLRERCDMPQWYDLLLLVSAAINGVVMGFMSLQNIECVLTRYVRPASIHKINALFFLLCGYGIYLGRYLRWNSWSIITHPYGILADIGQDIRHPFHNSQSWMLSILFGIWLYILYRYFKMIRFPGNARLLKIS